MEQIGFDSLVQNLFYGMASVIGTMAMVLGTRVLSCLRTLTDGVADLNLKIAVIISELKNHDHRLNNLEKKQ